MSKKTIDYSLKIKRSEFYLLYTSFFFILIVFCSACSSSFPTDQVIEKEVKDVPSQWYNAAQLLPPMEIPLKVDFYFPQNYVSGNLMGGSIDAYSPIIIGSKEVVRDFNKNKNLEIAFLEMLCTSVVQTGIDSFSHEENLKQLVKKEAPSMELKKLKWGNYPVLTLTGTHANKIVFQAWIGMNYESWVMLIELSVPNADKIHEAELIWNNFIKQTKIQGQ